MANKKKEYYKPGPMTEGKRNIIQGLLQEYNIESAADIQEALKDLLGGTIKEMMEAEMDEHLGYAKSERSDSDDARNGYKSKRITTSYGGMEIEVPQDRKSTFEPKVVKKRQKDISEIDQKIISMYAKGMTTRKISETLMDIYGFEASEGFISDVTDKLLPQIEEWQKRPLSEIYPVVFIDAIHYSVRDNNVIQKLAAYVILGINCEGRKEEPRILLCILLVPKFRTFGIALLRTDGGGIADEGHGGFMFVCNVHLCISLFIWIFASISKSRQQAERPGRELFR